MRTPYLPPTPLPDEDWSADDAALRRFLARHLSPATWKALEPRLSALGRAAPHEIDAFARQADARGPTLDASGDVVFDASYGELQRLARKHEAFTLSWRPLGDEKRAPRLATLALGYLFAQAECGYYCPACMTDGAAFVLDRRAPAELARATVPRLVQREAEGAYEGAMLLTEPQGGSDVGATRTTARQGADGAWLLTGDKWFASNANAQVILTLARMPGGAAGTRGLGLFLIPAHLDDGARNPGLHRMRLKEKLGVRSMATAEVELRDARAFLVAGEGEGFKAMAEMVNLSRLYNAVASVAIARRALREGQKNARWRESFGKKLAEHPLYVAQLGALANDVRGALFLTLDTARAFDALDTEYALLRALTPLAKAGTARLAVDAASQGCEFLGGNGYVEEWVTPRLLRDAQVLPIWEGTTNVQALDLLRAMTKDGAMGALVRDSLRLLEGAPHAVTLEEAWRALADEVAAGPREASAARWMFRAYHLRAATLLADDARDGERAAQAHAEAYVLRHVLRDDAGFERVCEERGALLAF